MERDPVIRITAVDVAKAAGGGDRREAREKQKGAHPQPGGPPIVITHEEIAADELTSIFASPALARFIEFVQAGLPQEFLRMHPDLCDRQTVASIGNALEKLSDPALKGHLQARLAVLKDAGHEKAV